MKAKRWLLCLLACLALMLWGCKPGGPADGQGVGGAPEQAGDAASPAGEAMYIALDRLIRSPESADAALPGRFTFAALIMEEAQSVAFGETDAPGIYHPACISRNDEDFFLLEVSAIQQDFHAGDLVKITGELNGSVYWDEGGGRVQALDIKALAMEALAPSQVQVITTPAFVHQGNDWTFLGAHRTLGGGVVAYLDFTNNSEGDAFPDMGTLYAYYGDGMAEAAAVDPQQTHAQALPADPANQTPSGERRIYYQAYSVDESAEEDIIHFALYDDEFRLTHHIGILILPTAEDLFGEGGQGSPPPSI